MSKGKKFMERRKHVRLPIMHGILEPVMIDFICEGSDKHIPQPAVLSDLSAGGMRLVTFLEPPHSKELKMVLSLDGLGEMLVTGKISWVKQKGGVYMNGISFTRIKQEDIKKISDMAEDYADCDMRVALKLPEVCVETCKAHYLCNKLQKNDVFFEDKA